MIKFKFIGIFLSVVIISLVHNTSSCQTIDEELTIGIIGDQTGAYDIDFAYQVLATAVQKLNRHRPDIVLHVGDIVESIKGVQNFEDFENSFKRARGIMDKLDCPWYLTAGDHDVVPPDFKQASDNRSRELWFKTLCRNGDLPLKDSLYYSFDFKGYHFISLYSLENLHTDPRWGAIFLNKITASQLAWLRDDLEKHKDAKGIFVFVHHPHWYVWSNWSEVHQILKKYPVAAVIAGHYHYDQDGGTLDGIRYLVMGSTGGVVKKTDIHSGGSYQYATLKLNGYTVSDIRLYDVKTDSLLELTPRRSMDRIQALSCMINNIYMDEDIYLRNGILYKKDTEGNYKKLQEIGLESLANPIDLPVEIAVSSECEGLYNARWIKNSESKPAISAVVLSPGDRVGWSNYSSVGQWYKPDPFWLCDIKSDSVFWSGQSDIKLTIKATFKDYRERWIISDTSFKLKKAE